MGSFKLICLELLPIKSLLWDFFLFIDQLGLSEDLAVSQ